MRTIIFQKLNFNYIYFILYLVASLITSGIEIYGDTDSDTKSTNRESDSKKCDFNSKGHFFELVNIFANTFSDFWAIIPYLIKKNRSKNSNKDTNKLIQENDSRKRAYSFTSLYIYNNLLEDQINKRWKYLNIYSFLVSFLDFCAEITLFLYYVIVDKNNKKNSFSVFSLLNCTVIFQIVFQYILSKFILKTEFYKHHYLSIIINSVLFVALLIIDLKTNIGFEPLYIIFYFLYCIFIVIENTYGKKAMIYGYISPYTLLIFKGIYKLLLLIVFSIIFIPIISHKPNYCFFNDIDDDITTPIIIVFLNFIFVFFSDMFNWILIDKFSPSHLALSIISEDISYLIIFEIMSKINNDENENEIGEPEAIARIFIYITLLITAMIHNEIFIITKCGLGDNTKLFLDEKVKEEMLLSNLDGGDIEVLKRYDTMIELEINANNEENENNNDANREEVENIELNNDNKENNEDN